MSRRVFYILICFTLWTPSVWAAPFKVIVSVLPQRYFVERVGAGRVQAYALVAPGHSPAAYDPSPRQMVELAEARIYFRIGVPFEKAWLHRIQAVNPRMAVVDNRAAAGLDIEQDESEVDDGHDHGHGAQDPHIWTSPPLVKKIAAQIRDQLSRLDPAGSASYAQNYQAFALALDALDKDLQNLLKPLKKRRFMVFHPSWGHFAAHYALEQISIERDGKEPGARALAELSATARREGITHILVQPQFNRRNAEVIAQAVGAELRSADPLALDYLDNMRRTAKIFVEMLQ